MMIRDGFCWFEMFLIDAAFTFFSFFFSISPAHTIPTLQLKRLSCRFLIHTVCAFSFSYFSQYAFSLRSHQTLSFTIFFFSISSQTKILFRFFCKFELPCSLIFLWIISLVWFFPNSFFSSFFSLPSQFYSKRISYTKFHYTQKSVTTPHRTNMSKQASVAVCGEKK